MGEGDLKQSGDPRLDEQLHFTALIDRMCKVSRRNLLVDGSRRENDAEHSWHIGVMALIFSEYAAQKPDIGRTVQMCMVHDLVEIYAGDTFAYDEKGNSNKTEREEAAADRLFSQLPEEQGRMIRDLWMEFDAMETVDARYAACLDRLQPFLHNTLTEGHTWKESGTFRSAVEKRMKPVKEFMPRIYGWMEMNMDIAVEKGWLKDG
ncbi:MAG: HD domain-containing protein [Lachnospiraceae bacterium]|nr:HD domain-containing protein [Lachnospiraceae bacterium]